MTLSVRYKTRNERKPMDIATGVHRCCLPGHRMFLVGKDSEGKAVLLDDHAVVEIIETAPAVPCERKGE